MKECFFGLNWFNFGYLLGGNILDRIVRSEANVIWRSSEMGVNFSFVFKIRKD